MSLWKKYVYTFIVYSLTLCYAQAIEETSLPYSYVDSLRENLRVLEIDEVIEDTHATYNYIYLLEDSLDQFTIEQVQNAKFQLVPDFFNSGNTRDNYSTYWLKIVVKNTLDSISDWMLVLSPRNSYVDFYTKNKAGNFTVKKSGAILPVEEKEFKEHNGIMFALHLPPETTKELYFKIVRTNNFPPRFDLNIQSRDYWESQIGDENRYLAIGFLQGALWLMAFFFMTFFITTKEKSYLYYALFLIFTASCFLYDMFPYALERFLGDQVHLTLHIWVFVNLLYVFFALFVRSFVQAPKLIPKWDILFKLLIYSRLICALIAVVIISFWYDFALADLIYSTYLMPFEMACWFFLIPILFSKGDKIVRFFLVGVVLFILSAVLFADIIVHTNLTDDLLVYAWSAGFILQFLFFSSALGYRSYLLNIEKKKALQKYINQLRENERLQAKINLELEDKVRERTAKIESQNQILKQQSKRLKELDHLKSQFIANISHEFRTPLTLILTPLQKLMGQVKDTSLRAQYALMIRHGENLLNLINQLLDLSQQKEGKVAFKPLPVEVANFVKNIAVSFNPIAESKKIDYQYEVPQKEILASLDPDKLMRIVENLLSNAFKFTPEHGKVKLKLSSYKGHDDGEACFTLEVEDTGVGIPEDKRTFIFDRFYRIQSPHGRAYGGTGIGLALVKEYVQLHKGNIQMESLAGDGTKFIVTLPLGKIPAEDMSLLEKQVVLPEPSIKNHQQTEVEEESSISSKEDQDLPVILLVEDHYDLRNYLKSHLKSDYHVKEAKNGDEGLALATSHLPDLIISDVMMPGISGLEFCQQLKESPLTNHIPIIMLTAKADLESKVTGWSVGADAYLTKPFALSELEALIKNLLLSRKKLQERYMQQLFSDNSESSVKDSVDDPFLQTLEGVLERYHSNPDLHIEDLTKEMAMSRSQLYRKIKSLTGKSPNAFIRKFRLHRAARLLEKDYGNVSMVSDAVGFSNDSYFSKCFQKEFGHLPSDHITIVHKG